MKYIYIFLLFTLFSVELNAQHSVARRWNEVQLEAIREDRVRPPVQSRNLFHVAMAMYDAWAIYDQVATPFYIGKTFSGVYVPLNPVAPVVDTEAAREMAISYAAYRILSSRYAASPNYIFSQYRFDTLMANLGYDPNYTSVNYETGTPADLGNYIANWVLNLAYYDGANEVNNYAYTDYFPLNTALKTDSSGSQNMVYINNWQPLDIIGALDQGGNPIPALQVFVNPEWGRVTPFAFTPSQKTIHYKNGGEFPVYSDPGPPPMLDTTDPDDVQSKLFKWGHTLVSVWSSHLDPDDGVFIDISPASSGNYPLNYNPIEQHQSYYDFFNGGDSGTGYTVNPYTSMPYTPQIVKRGDWTRVLSQFWADGPNSETPPGHWFTIMNYVSDHPLVIKQFEGVGDTLGELEWDVKAYLALGGAVHDAAIDSWGIKGLYDSPRPISALRKMAEYGQATDSTLPHYHPGGLELIPNYVELIDSTDSLAGTNYENVNKIKLYTWKGFDYIDSAATDYAGVGWILAENWMPYQRPSFVTPPFAGYVSGHSTFSRAGAEVLTAFTGNEYFPGGLGEFPVTANSGYLVFEQGPTTNITLQWAKYRDASNEASLSRFWGGIHPPFDDMYGRVIGEEAGVQSFNLAKMYFDGSILPLHLISFHTRNENCDTKLEWKVSNEQEVDHYEIWISKDGKHYAEKIAQIPSIGNHKDIHTYQYLHMGLKDAIIYKLVSVDLDQTQQTLAYGNSNNTNCDPFASAISIYPNPCKDFIRVKMNEEQDYIDVHLLSLNGNVVQVYRFDGYKNEIEIDLGDIAEGNYLLRINGPNGDLGTKLIQKN